MFGKLSKYLKLLLSFFILLFLFSSCSTTGYDDPINRDMAIAVLSGDVYSAKQALIKGADKNTRGSDGMSYLHLAAKAGKLEVMKLLIRIGCDIDDEDEKDYTPLHYAIINNRSEVAKLLISKNADVNAKNHVGKTPLHCAVVSLPNISDDTPSIPPNMGSITSEFGLRKSPFRQEYQFHSGIDIASHEGTKIKATANGFVTKAGWNGGFGNTVQIQHKFGFETMYGHCRELKVKRGDRIQKGDIIATVGKTGRTTGSHCHYEIRFNDMIINPYPYLHDAKIHKNQTSDIYSITRLLLEKGAEINARDRNGRTPLHDVVNRDLESTRLLVRIGADLNAMDKKGRTPLHQAASNNLEVVEYLLKKGVNVNSRTNAEYAVINGKVFLKGATPLKVATMNEQPEIIEILKKHGAKM